MRKRIRVITRVSLVGSLSFFFLFSGSSVLRNWSVSAGCLHETEAIFRDPGMQWMVLLCLAVYGATFLFLRRSKIGRYSLGSRRGDEADDRGPQQVPPSHVGGYGDSITIWLTGFLGLGVLAYTLDYFTASKSTQALMLLGTAALGLGAGVWSSWSSYGTSSPRPSPPATLGREGEEIAERCSPSSFGWMVPATFVCLLVVASLWQSETARAYEYRGNSRWTGPWDNPNTFGSLMGTGLILALAMGIGGLRMESRSWKRIVVFSSFLVAAFFLGRGLFNSYSRGAWLATACGGAYLLWHCISREMRGTRESHPVCSSRGDEAPSSKCGTGMRESESDRASSRRLLRLIERFHFSWFKRNWLPVAVVVISVALLAFWHFRQMEWHPARRALSVANANDFSWRNRIAAWEGTLQMMAEKPWFGFGWNQPEPMYENYYLLPRLEESAAIQMNDYLMLGATLGVPALFCFGMYLWLSLSGGSGARCQVSGVRKSKKHNTQRDPALPSTISNLLSSSEWLAITCRAGAIVLLVGFWFDGGLFKLATASTFWILLELGRTDVNRRGAEAQSFV